MYKMEHLKNFIEKINGLSYSSQCDYIKNYHLIYTKNNLLCFLKSYICYLTIYLLTLKKLLKIIKRIYAILQVYYQIMVNFCV